MKELFEVEEVLSPRLQWVRDHDVRSYHAAHLEPEELPWCCWFPSNASDHPNIPENPEACGYGKTEKEAHEDLAAMRGFVNWKKLSAESQG